LHDKGNSDFAPRNLALPGGAQHRSIAASERGLAALAG